MSQSERNDLDDAIDRAAQQLVSREPPPRLHAAVMADIRAGSKAGSDVWTWRWALAGMSAAAAIAVTVLVLVWQMQTQRPAVFTAVSPGLPASPPQAVATVAPKPPSPSPSPSPVGRHEGRMEIAPPPIAQVAIAGPEIDVEKIQVATIPVADISVADIPVSPIQVTDIENDRPISVSTIGTDGK